MHVCDKNEKRQEEDGKQKKVKVRPKRDEPWGSLGSGSFSFSFLIMGQNWLSVSAASEGPHKRTEAVTRMQQEVQIKENRWTEATSKMEAVERARQNWNEERSKKIDVSCSMGRLGVQRKRK